jgi:hypothetical protein
MECTFTDFCGGEQLYYLSGNVMPGYFGAWETQMGLNPSDASDGNETTLSSIGYTNLEMYLNELAGDFK